MRGIAGVLARIGNDEALLIDSAAKYGDGRELGRRCGTKHARCRHGPKDREHNPVDHAELTQSFATIPGELAVNMTLLTESGTGAYPYDTTISFNQDIYSGKDGPGASSRTSIAKRSTSSVA